MEKHYGLAEILFDRYKRIMTGKLTVYLFWREVVINGCWS
jgi:hypothetical protein